MNSDPVDLLPHKPPMVFVDRVIACDLAEGTLESEFDVSPKSLFFDAEKNGVPAYVALEYMAQTIGCFSGIVDKMKTQEEPARAGLVLGSRKLELFRDFFTEGTYRVSISKVFFDDEIGAFESKIFCGNELVAAGTLNVFRPKNLDEFTGNRL